MLKRIDHLGIAVKDLEAGIRLYRDLLGMEPETILEFEPEQVKIAFFPVGEASIELLMPLSEECAIGQHIQKRGEGIHHICYRVDDLSSAAEKLKSEGLRVLDSEPREGAHGTKVLFFHPKDTCSHLIELSESTA